MSHLIKTFDASIFEIDQERGMVNLTRIAKYFKANVNDWTRTKGTQSFFAAYANEYPETKIIDTVKGGDGEQGTWVPRQIAIEFAQWISPAFKVYCIKKLDELFQTGKTELSVRRMTTKEALMLALEAENRAEAAEQKLIEAEPKVQFYDEVTESEDVMDFATVAKLLNRPGFGRNNLFEFLRTKGVLRSNNEPYQTYVDNGWFKVVETRWTGKTGDIKISIKTVVFQKGVDGIRKLLDKSQAA
jgi:phage antirepressor YoqD-like protein